MYFRFDLVYLNNHYQDIYFHIDFVAFLVYDNNHLDLFHWNLFEIIDFDWLILYHSKIKKKSI